MYPPYTLIDFVIGSLWVLSQLVVGYLSMRAFLSSGRSPVLGFLVGWFLTFCLWPVGALITLFICGYADDKPKAGRGSAGRQSAAVAGESAALATRSPFDTRPDDSRRLQPELVDLPRGEASAAVRYSSPAVLDTPTIAAGVPSRAQPRVAAKAPARPKQGRHKSDAEVPPYLIVDVEQNTPEWQEWRDRGIGGSDAARAIAGLDTARRAQLMDEKLYGSTRPRTEAMKLGHQLEPEARRLYEAAIGVRVRPVLLQSTRYKWLLASLDGLALDGSRAVEIKCGERIHRTTCSCGRPPSEYKAQLQHYLAVTGLEEIDFWCYWPGCRTVHVVVERDEGYIESMLERERAFWKELKRLRRGD